VRTAAGWLGGVPGVRAASRDPTGTKRCSASGRRRRGSTETRTLDRRSRHGPTLHARSPSGAARRLLSNGYDPGRRHPRSVRCLCRSGPRDLCRSVREGEVGGNRADRRAAGERLRRRPPRSGHGDERG
jgi:hypothetical protein